MAESDQSANRPKRKAPRTAFKPGQSGNPKGRPKAMFKFGEYLRQFLDSDHPQAADINAKLGVNAVKSQLDVIVQRLAKDDPKVLLQYAFGKPIESHELSAADGQPLKLYSVLASPDDL
jgi:hypothetical protein